MPADRSKYLTRKKFDEFLSNDFEHLKRDVHFIKGQLWIIVPVMLAILGAVLGLLNKVI